MKMASEREKQWEETENYRRKQDLMESLQALRAAERDGLFDEAWDRALADKARDGEWVPTILNHNQGAERTYGTWESSCSPLFASASSFAQLLRPATKPATYPRPLPTIPKPLVVPPPLQPRPLPERRPLPMWRRFLNWVTS